jgi:hypothetical protein
MHALEDKEYLSLLKKSTENNALRFDVQPYISRLKTFLTTIMDTK